MDFKIQNLEEKKVVKLRLWEVGDLVQERSDIKIPSQVCFQDRVTSREVYCASGFVVLGPGCLCL